jgi:RNase H-fold protein (predicted Holliday junction resolvase)
MKLMALTPFLRALPAKKSIAAIDFGTKRIGVAITDETRCFAFPLTTLNRNESAIHHRMSPDTVSVMLDALQSVCREHHVGALVIGFPVYNGVITPMCKEILKVVTMGATLYKVPLVVRYMKTVQCNKCLIL